MLVAMPLLCKHSDKSHTLTNLTDLIPVPLIPHTFRFYLNPQKGFEFTPSLFIFNIYEVPPLSPGDCCEQVSAPSIGLSPLSALSRPRRQ